jgi:hypothetical protein
MTGRTDPDAGFEPAYTAPKGAWTRISTCSDRSGAPAEPLGDWADAALRRRILVDNPARRFEF